jgi:hypothetical protein
MTPTQQAYSRALDEAVKVIERERLSLSLPTSRTRPIGVCPPTGAKDTAGAGIINERMEMNYQEFIKAKSQAGENQGFNPLWVPDFLFDFQKSLVEWATQKGRAAIFADCGLGKTPMQLVWAENVCRKTDGKVLILTPLAVSGQTVREAEKFGIDCKQSRDGKVMPRITVTNYEKLHLFNSTDFAGCVCDESSILKNPDGVTKSEVTHFMRKMPFRLLCTATAAPNDYIELGTSSEAIGDLGFVDMLGRFFKNNQNTIRPSVYRHRGQDFSALEEGAKWRFRGHAEKEFWRWICSWARACRNPSDMGFDDARFILPPLQMREHIIRASKPLEGYLFDMPAVGLQEQRSERSRTIDERVELAADLVNTSGAPAICWGYLNTECDLLEKLIPDAVQVSGNDSDEQKEESFAGFTDGKIRVLVTKPVIGSFGMNWQHCSHQTFFPSHSFEQFYQAVRRSWRFGQTKPVRIDIIASEGERGVLKSIERKTAQAEVMFSNLVALMNKELRIEKRKDTNNKMEVPSWVSTNK